MSSGKLSPGEEGYGSGESSSSVQPSPTESQNAAAASLEGGMLEQQQKQQNQLTAVSFHDIHYQVRSLCSRKIKTILHGVR